VVSFLQQLRSPWVTIYFAAVVSEAVPYRQIWDSSQFHSLFASAVRELPYPHLLVFLIAWKLLVAPRYAPSATRSTNASSTGNRSLAAVLVLPLSYLGMMFLSLGLSVGLSLLRLPLPRVFLYYVALRLPLFLSLVVSVWIARPGAARSEATRLPA
jgi:hypothetical protein